MPPTERRATPDWPQTRQGCARIVRPPGGTTQSVRPWTCMPSLPCSLAGVARLLLGRRLADAQA
eukprot:7625724-Alexandrium_andersonii.AAC.1